jgi:hypothetical protein
MLGTELVRALRRAGVVAPVVLTTANPERGFNEAACTLPSAEPGPIP